MVGVSPLIKNGLMVGLHAVAHRYRMAHKDGGKGGVDHSRPSIRAISCALNVPLRRGFQRNTAEREGTGRTTNSIKTKR